MEDGNIQSENETRFAFIGKVLATFTHELKNHLAIIKEYNGLIYDLIELGKSPEKDPEQYLSTVKSISAQIDRTLSLISYLNRFSHRMDHAFSTFNVNDALEELFILIHRLTNQKKIMIQSDFQRDLPQVCNDPFRLQLAVFGVIEGFMGRTGQEAGITAKTSFRDDVVSISFQHTGDIIAETPGRERICSHTIVGRLLKEVGIEMLLDEGRGAALISIPVSLSSPEGGKL